MLLTLFAEIREAVEAFRRACSALYMPDDFASRYDSARASEASACRRAASHAALVAAHVLPHMMSAHARARSFERHDAGTTVHALRSAPAQRFQTEPCPLRSVRRRLPFHLLSPRHRRQRMRCHESR